MLATVIIVMLLVALLNANSNKSEPNQNNTTALPVSNKPDTVVNAFDLDTYMKQNNITAFFCSHENKIYWVKDAENTLFCPHDSTLLYAC